MRHLLALAVLLVALPANAGQPRMLKVCTPLAIKSHTAVLWIKRDRLIDTIAEHLHKDPRAVEWARKMLAKP
jgi:hypothetical protein